MSRISKEVQAKYPLRIREGQTEEQCYFCNGIAGSEDYTPAPSASDRDKNLFTEPFVRVKTCTRCWKRIYTVNIADRGIRFNVQRGCMTLLQKEALFGNEEAAKSISSAQNPYSIGFDPPIVAPLGLNKLESGNYVWNTTTLHPDEVVALQGALSVKMMGLSSQYIEVQLLMGLASGELNGDRIDLYREMLGLPSQYEMIHGTSD